MYFIYQIIKYSLVYYSKFKYDLLQMYVLHMTDCYAWK